MANDDAPDEGAPAEHLTETGQQPEEAPPTPARRARKRKIIAEKAEDLAPWNFFRDNTSGAIISVVVDGDGIGTEAGEMGAIGLALQRFAGLLTALGARPVMRSLAFGNSVIVELQPAADEVRRSKSELRTAVEQRLLAADGLVVVGADASEANSALVRAVPDIYVAASLAADLLEKPSSAAPEFAISLGVDVAKAYRTLSNAVADHRLNISVKGPERESPVRLTHEKAARVAEELKTSKERRHSNVTVYGVLSIADAEHRQFGLRPDPDRARDPAIKGKRLIAGTYTQKAGRQMLDLGLWGKPVRATVRVDRDALISSTTLRPAAYSLIDARAVTD